MRAFSPSLRFPEFDQPWESTPFSQLLRRVSNPVQVAPGEVYREIGVRSHGKGLFHKRPVFGEALGNKRVFQVVPDALVLNIVFAWEQAVALTSDKEVEFIASHRFPMFLENEERSYLPFIKQLLLTPKGKILLEIASPGGAGRNKTLGQDAFLKLKPVVPKRDEQKKIADFVGAVAEKVSLLTEKKSAMEEYKRGVMQQLFSRALRFTRDDGSDFPDWKERKLGGLGGFAGGGTPDTNVLEYWKGKTAWVSSSDLAENRIKSLKIERRITEEAIRQSATQITPKGAVLIVTRVGIGKCAIAPEDVCTSQDFTNFIPNDGVPEFYAYWLCRNKRKLLSVAQGTSIKGVTTHDLKALTIMCPHPDEQRKIADFLSSIDAKIEAVSAQISEMETFKKGLLQKMFV
ncbi:restriction endonuclease subunit S [Falsiruegeria mediterranea]|uniref:Type I restriction modification DNA specificity domain-containing protein n=1 Tax=Falsiruegeria mediterranea M17 TaxID=1200281 RepID=A0A2R8C414_9RHOB|nr:restriction endonuclease subunit S [Falsiruegeria mediterranea]SPJ27175.1 hypothetical protein TRM7615_00657 [Falsiruegeria mediterranea M17]